MESITLVKYAWRGTRKTLGYIKARNAKQKKKREKSKGVFGTYLNYSVMIFFAGICLFALSPFSHTLSHKSQAHQTSPSSTTARGLALYSATLQQSEKVSTLSLSASSALTAYPDKSADALSSATLDEQTGHQEYMHYAGKGGVMGRQANTQMLATLPSNCPQPLPAKLLQYISGSFTKFTCSGVQDDFLTSSGGVLFTIPDNLTVTNAAVVSIVQAVQLSAGLALVPVIALIGLSMITKFGNISYATALESLPRLMLSLIGIWLCLALAQTITDTASAVMSGFWSAFQGSINGFPDITTMIIPSSLWKEWLIYLLVLGVALIVSQVLAPLMILGNDFGAFISVAIIAAITGLLIGDAAQFVQLSFSMALGAEIIIRIILIDLYIILSPFAMVAIGLPGQTGVKFARDWTYGFLSLVASQIGQVVVLGIGMVVLTTYTTGGGSVDVVEAFIKFGTLALMLRVPSLFKSNAADLVKQVGPMVASSVQHERTVFF